MSGGSQACVTPLMSLTQIRSLLCRPCGHQSHSAQPGRGLQDRVTADREPLKESMQFWKGLVSHPLPKHIQTALLYILQSLAVPH